MSQTFAPVPTPPTNSAVDTTTCPQCGAIARIRQRDVLRSTSGPVEHVGIVCVARHAFLLPTAVLEEMPA